MNKNVLILGGSSGIGLECAKHLDEIGYNVIIASRNKPINQTLEHLCVDVTDEHSVKNLFYHFTKNNMALYGVIYTVGITKKQMPIDDFNLNDFKHIFSTNLIGAILVCKYAHKLLTYTQGRVIVINTIASRTYSKYSGIDYVVSKSALSGLVRQLAMEWAEDKILVNAIYPSTVKTPMLYNTLNEEEIANLSKGVPLGQLTMAIEIAKSVEFLLDKSMQNITGIGIDINGGQYLNG